MKRNIKSLSALLVAMLLLSMAFVPAVSAVKDEKPNDVVLKLVSTSGDVTILDVATAPISGTITEADPSDSWQVVIPQGTWSTISANIKYYTQGSDLRLKLVKGGTVLNQDDGPSWPWPESYTRSVSYTKNPIFPGEVYNVVIEKISLAGDTRYDGTITIQS